MWKGKGKVFGCLWFVVWAFSRSSSGSCDVDPPNQGCLKCLTIPLEGVVSEASMISEMVGKATCTTRGGCVNAGNMCNSRRMCECNGEVMEVIKLWWWSRGVRRNTRNESIETAVRDSVGREQYERNIRRSSIMGSS
jgi:hypothetical protein